MGFASIKQQPIFMSTNDNSLLKVFLASFRIMGVPPWLDENVRMFL